jgi:hypothetical protein
MEEEEVVVVVVAMEEEEEASGFTFQGSENNIFAEVSATTAGCTWPFGERRRGEERRGEEVSDTVRGEERAVVVALAWREFERAGGERRKM